jgi:hypothetical protein
MEFRRTSLKTNEIFWNFGKILILYQLFNFIWGVVYKALYVDSEVDIVGSQRRKQSIGFSFYRNKDPN